MTHLPECRKPAHFKAGCICDRLRACQARTIHEARQAVMAAEYGDRHDIWDAALAAVSSVIEES